MAQFKFIGNTNGAAPEYKAGTTINVKGLCNIFAAETYEIDVEVEEVFVVPDAWATAIADLTAATRKGLPLYERVS